MSKKLYELFGFGDDREKGEAFFFYVLRFLKGKLDKPAFHILVLILKHQNGNSNMYVTNNYNTKNIAMPEDFKNKNIPFTLFNMDKENFPPYDIKGFYDMGKHIDFYKKEMDGYFEESAIGPRLEYNLVGYSKYKREVGYKPEQYFYEFKGNLLNTVYTFCPTSIGAILAPGKVEISINSSKMKQFKIDDDEINKNKSLKWSKEE